MDFFLHLPGLLFFGEKIRTGFQRMNVNFSPRGFRPIGFQLSFWAQFLASLFSRGMPAKFIRQLQGWDGGTPMTAPFTSKHLDDSQKSPWSVRWANSAPKLVEIGEYGGNLGEYGGNLGIPILDTWIFGNEPLKDVEMSLSTACGWCCKIWQKIPDFRGQSAFVPVDFSEVWPSLRQTASNCQLISVMPSSMSQQQVSMESCNVLVGFLCCENLGNRKQLLTAVRKVFLAKLALAQSRSLVFELGVPGCRTSVTPRWSGSAKRWVHVPEDLLVRSHCRWQARQASKWCKFSDNSLWSWLLLRFICLPHWEEGTLCAPLLKASSFRAWGSWLPNKCYT